MDKNEIVSQISALTNSLDTIVERATTAKDSVVSGGNAPPYDAAYIQDKLNAFDALFDTLNMGGDPAKVIFDEMFLPLLMKDKGPVSQLPTTSIGGQAAYVVSEEGVYNVSQMSNVRLNLISEPGKIKKYVFYAKKYETVNITPYRLDGGTAGSNVNLNAEKSCVIYLVDETNSAMRLGPLDTSALGTSIPFRRDAVVLDTLTNKPSIGSYARSLVISDPSTYGNDGDIARNEIFGSIAADSAPYTPLGNPDFTSGNHYTYLSDVPVSVNRDLGLAVGAQYGVKTSLSPEFELLDSYVCEYSRKIESYSEDGEVYVILGGAQYPETTDVRETAKVSVLQYNETAELMPVDVKGTFGTGALEVFVDDGELRIAEFQYRRGTSLPSPIRVYDFDTVLGKLVLKSNTSTRNGAEGSLTFDVNGVDYFLVWPKDPLLATRFYQQDDSETLFELTIGPNISKLRNIVQMGTSNDGFPVIFGIDVDGSAKSYDIIEDPNQGITISEVPRVILTAGADGIPAGHVSRQLLTFMGTDKKRTIISSPVAPDSPALTEPLEVVVNGGGAIDGPILTTTVLGKATSRKSFHLDGFSYLIAVEPGPSGHLKIFRHITDATFEEALSIDLNEPVDAAYTFNNNVHLLSVLSDGGSTVHTYEFRTDKFMLNWRRTSFTN